MNTLIAVVSPGPICLFYVFYLRRHCSLYTVFGFNRKSICAKGFKGAIHILYINNANGLIFAKQNICTTMKMAHTGSNSMNSKGKTYIGTNICQFIWLFSFQLFCIYMCKLVCMFCANLSKKTEGILTDFSGPFWMPLKVLLSHLKLGRAKVFLSV